MRPASTRLDPVRIPRRTAFTYSPGTGRGPSSATGARRSRGSVPAAADSRRGQAAGGAACPFDELVAVHDQAQIIEIEKGPSTSVPSAFRSPIRTEFAT